MIRRSFLKFLPTAFAGSAAANAADGSTDSQRGPEFATRVSDAYLLRARTAAFQRDQAVKAAPGNDDESRVPNFAACFSKGLPHDSHGQVTNNVYRQYTASLAQGRLVDLATIPMAGGRLVNPLAAHAFSLEGGDPQCFSMNRAPAFSSAEMAAEMVELYWMAACRDVPFADYASSPLVRQACEELTRLPAYPASREKGDVSPNNVFRPNQARSLAGPYISQLLCKAIPFSDNLLPQTWRFAPAGRDFMTREAAWLAVQNGAAAEALPLDPVRRHIRNGRDLASYVHKDYSFQIFLHAALILMEYGAPVQPLWFPYRTAAQNQVGFATFGGPFILDLVAKAANAAIKAAWYQKWLIHRRLRPEEMAGRVHYHRLGAAHYPIHNSLLSSNAVKWAQERTGASFLPQAYPEGCPLHPSYPSGHGTVSGACATVLKALFRGDEAFPDPVVSTADGSALQRLQGVSLSVAGEIDKLAGNVAFGRNWAGIHYWSDAVDGILLGEKVATRLLQDTLTACPEPIHSLVFPSFAGAEIKVERS
jgi:membrane-associated phospholipid phosphatase